MTQKVWNSILTIVHQMNSSWISIPRIRSQWGLKWESQSSHLSLGASSWHFSLPLRWPAIGCYQAVSWYTTNFAISTLLLGFECFLGTVLELTLDRELTMNISFEPHSEFPVVLFFLCCLFCAQRWGFYGCFIFPFPIYVWLYLQSSRLSSQSLETDFSLSASMINSWMDEFPNKLTSNRFPTYKVSR
jgi:hypothetical protein